MESLTTVVLVGNVAGLGAVAHVGLKIVKVGWELASMIAELRVQHDQMWEWFKDRNNVKQ